MMQGIWTKYSGSRIKAIARTRNSWGGEQPEMALRLAYDHALNADENHAAAGYCAMHGTQSQKQKGS